MSGMSGRLATGALWIGASRVLASLFGLANTVVLARLLEPEDFGLVAIATTIGLILIVATEISMSDALVQHTDPRDDHFNTAFTFNMLRGAFLALLAGAIAWPVAVFYEDLRLIPLIITAGCGTIVAGATNPKLALMLRGLVFWQDFALRLGERLVGFVAALLIAVLWQSYWALMIGPLVGQVVGVSLGYLIKPFRPRLTVSKWRELFSFSIWLSLGNFLNTANTHFDQLLVGHFLGNRQLGYYTVGSRLAYIPTREVMHPVIRVTYPGFARIAHDVHRLRKAYTRAQTLFTAVVFALSIGLIMLADPLVRIAMGEKWLPVVPIIQLLSGTYAFQTIGTPVNMLCMALGQTRLLFNRSVMIFSFRVPMIIFGFLAGGLPGLLLARAGSGLMELGINMWLANRLINITPWQQLWANRRTFAATLTAALATWVTGQALELKSASLAGAPLLETIVLGIILTVTFCVTLFILWRAEGQPEEGPETDLRNGFRRLSEKLRKSPQQF